ncbi:MAG: hypothetical protein DA408_20310 [Bacteroidetes bacterium]|nr:MAG: hypothetical protein C7N36_09445 [Bacteroidota bacterium]PTM08570.1 MAG: hypothetical protein DA408_20310 [Bacteroidota bacterium]
MRYFKFLLPLALATVACQPAKSPETTAVPSQFTVLLDDNPQWAQDQLRLLPIVATANFINQQQDVAQYKVLGEALENERFRVSEKKPYGRFDDASAVNSLTVQNKTEAPVFLMAGDIVRGGNQDRVIAEDRIIAARSIDDVPVFCVEHGRWTYQGDQALNEADQKIFAFRGYYNVASSQLRRSVESGSQQAVWDQVADITTHHDATSGTSAYAALETNRDFVSRRKRYEHFFSNKLAANSQIVGFVAVSGNQILGADLFGHPALLRRQLPALVSGYATDALTIGNDEALSNRQLSAFVRELLQETAARNGFYADGELVHYAKLKD